MLIFNPPFIEGKLIKRYKRFLADIETQTGEIITIHCPNTGSMRNCLKPGGAIWYSDSNNLKRKYRYTWEITTTPAGDLAGINTGRANALVEEAIHEGLVAGLEGFTELRREVRYGANNSRADFCLTCAEQSVFIEVKNVTLLQDGQGYFPDAVSDRATKHLHELIRVVDQGNRAMLVYCVQHTGIDSVAAASHIDRLYGDTLRLATVAGVEVLALKATMTPSEIKLASTIPVLID